MFNKSYILHNYTRAHDALLLFEVVRIKEGEYSTTFTTPFSIDKFKQYFAHSYNKHIFHIVCYRNIYDCT